MGPTRGEQPKYQAHAVLGTGLAPLASTRGRAPCGGPQNTQHQATLARCPVMPSPSQTFNTPYGLAQSRSIAIRDTQQSRTRPLLGRSLRVCWHPIPNPVAEWTDTDSRRGFSRCPSTGGLCNLSNRVAINSPSQKQIELSNSSILTAELNTRAEACTYNRS